MHIENFRICGKQRYPALPHMHKNAIKIGCNINIAADLSLYLLLFSFRGRLGRNCFGNGFCKSGKPLDLGRNNNLGSFSVSGF